jgi:hypothetical protein
MAGDCEPSPGFRWREERKNRRGYTIVGLEGGRDGFLVGMKGGALTEKSDGRNGMGEYPSDGLGREAKVESGRRRTTAACVSDEVRNAGPWRGERWRWRTVSFLGLWWDLSEVGWRWSERSFSDYLNGVRKLRRILEGEETVGGAGKAWYRWILRLMDSLVSENVEFRHVKAHSDEDTEEANLNRKADEAAIRRVVS